MRQKVVQVGADGYSGGLECISKALQVIDSQGFTTRGRRDSNPQPSDRQSDALTS